MELSSHFKTLQDSISSSLVAATRTATQISSEDLSFHRSLDPSVGTALDQQNARLLALAERLLSNAASNTEVVCPQLPDADAVDGNWRGIVDVVDSLLEKADISLDEYTGAVKRLSPSREQTPTSTAKPLKQSRIAAALRSQDVPKPQLQFSHVPTNAEKEPFKPLLTSKPHATVPYEESMQIRESEDTTPQYPHPYETEIQQYEYPFHVYTQAEPIPYRPYESTTATFVDTEEAVEQMLQELKDAREIAIDLEHHDLRSYIGIVSLMQISTRNKDWIVDTLKPWRRKLSCLNEVFADPKILKVLHGAFMDIMWLQRDLGLYIVGLFDTHYAARALGYTGGSLAFLLKKFVDFDAQKQYQTADWRIRPLPAEMFDYARSDTHFLLYIYDNMRNELIEKSDFSAPNHEKDKINDVLVRSKDTALQTYQHPVYDAEHGLGPAGWYKMLSRTPALLSREQFSVFKAVHQWRDQVARQQDDSLTYVMANHNIFSIAKEMPVEKPALFSIAQPLTQTVRLRADELLAVIRKAKEEGANGPEMHKVLGEVDARLHGIAPVQVPDKPVTPATAATAATAARPAGAGTVVNRATATDAQPLRTTSSLFWGSTFDGSAWRQQRSMSSATSIRLPVPLPPLTASIFADVSEAATPIKPTSQPTSQPPTPRLDAHAQPAKTSNGVADGDDTVFTLKQAGRKRKSDVLTHSTPASPAVADTLATQDDEVDISFEGEEEALRAARREEKKAAKKARKAAAAAAAHEDETPFDYAAAPSLLNAGGAAREHDRRGKGKGRDKEKKTFNPYAKALDAPKGLPRAQKERAGRSMTFKQ